MGAGLSDKTAGRKSGKSKAVFVNEIKELAQKAAMTTNKKELDYIHYSFFHNSTNDCHICFAKRR